MTCTNKNCPCEDHGPRIGDYIVLAIPESPRCHVYKITRIGTTVPTRDMVFADSETPVRLTAAIVIDKALLDLAPCSGPIRYWHLK